MISIIIPIYNEEDNIILLSEKIKDCLKAFKYEVIFVYNETTENDESNGNFCNCNNFCIKT